ncbi:LysM peptidoglycan-binding domain-containing protein [Christiangramia echinicola]|uniref:ABC-type branched-chain amino acid transport system, substrate-binding protein n=1 Tax=Christiangramia echinicola TaxID=279359 RepID=A0A1H1Q6E1_9FLAO|nr:LysM peptidoglycan-binding domain-containing protein [Christiangramia echinicola]SDS18960.1 ABC-type branched-chain amino acid transport system, substrate-binding protein [Christiangramia echinicola]
MKYLFVICFLFQFYSTSANAQAYKYHTVKKGETVFSISQSYNIDEEDIYKYNPDAKEGIGINEKLVIPVEATRSENKAESNTQFTEHTVKKKETLYSLSKEYDVSVDDIKRYNKQLYSKELQMGETIRIPSGTAVASTNNTPVETQTISKETSVTKPQSNQITKTREHIVLPKETKYGIARKYGMTVKELESINPRVETLQPGMMIRVGVDVLEDEPVIITDDRFRFYEVKPKETIFSLTRRFGVSVDSLTQLNPALKNGLKFGMVLKVPEHPEGKDIEDDEVYTGMGEESNTKMDLSNSISNRSTKEIVLMLPYHLNKIEEDSIETYRNSILNERVVRISLDFHSGVLMAVDKAKSMGISTNLRVYDTKQNSSEVANIINANNFNEVDAVIGPLLQDPTEAVASRLESKNIPVINPLSNRSMRGYNNLFQSIPGEEYMKNAMLDFIAKNASGKNVVIVADGRAFKIKSEISNIIPGIRSVNPTNNYVSDQELKNALTTGSNIVILESDNINLVSSVTSALNRLARNHDITLLTTNKSNAFENDIVSNNHLGNLKLHYPSVDKEYDTDTTESFNEEYKERFNIEPNRYAIRGYDLTMDVLLRLASAGDLYESFEKYPGYTEYFESKFHYMPGTNGGFINDAIYILKLNKDLTINEANDL